ncbi:hypothetical protein [Streptomyces naganishii]|uniref:hypothetical protein n=1 Tax=Streptomyces naganishii TaxID=285447 RepID=UPI00167E4208|nr:hypothetical protein [Streptomyces naganishii]
MACVLALAAAVVWAVSRPEGGAAGPGRAPASAPAAHRWAPASSAPSGKGVLTLRDAPHVLYLPRYDPHAAAPYGPTYTFDLAAAPASPGGGQGSVGGIEVDLDLSALQGRAHIHPRLPGDCSLTGSRMKCRVPNVQFGRVAEVSPFYVLPGPGAVLGRTGTIPLTVRAANAPAIRHTTRLVVGSPQLTLRPSGKRLTGVRPGDAIRLTPAFGNKGDTGIDGGVSLLVTAQGATLSTRYSNCRYDKPTGATKAQCDFPGPLPAGTAFETDGPVTAKTGADARNGLIQDSVWRTADMPYFTALPTSAPHGTGAPLGLRPVDGGAFVRNDDEYSEVASGDALAFETSLHDDVAAVGFTIRGKVGATVDVTVPYPQGDGWSGPDDRGTLHVTLPAGVSLVEVPPEQHESDILYCYPSPRKDGTVACPGPAPPGTVMRVHIDRRVDGARGSVRADSDPALDPDRTDNTAPVTVTYLP